MNCNSENLGNRLHTPVFHTKTLVYKYTIIHLNLSFLYYFLLFRDSWSLTDVAPMSERRSFPCAVTINDCIYVMGGYDGNDTLRTCEVYNPASNDWTSIEPMTVARSNAGAAYLNRKIFVVGGWDGVSLSSVEYYDLVTHEWTRVSNLPRPTTGIRCCILVSQHSNEQKPKKSGKSGGCCIC